MKKIIPSDFYRYTINRKIDVDGAYKNQCVDLFIYYCKKADIPYRNTVTGWASGLFTHRKDYYKQYFEVITDFKKLKTGDWIFTKKPEHVAMWYNGKMLGQNQNGKLSAVDLKPFNGTFIGAFRQKAAKNDNIQSQSGIEYLATKVIKKDFGDGHETRRKNIYNFLKPHVKAYLEGYITNEQVLDVVKNICSGKYGTPWSQNNLLYESVRTKVNILMKGK